MPRSKTRKHHHEHHTPANAEKAKKNRSPVLFMVILCTVIGLGMAWFASESSPVWLAAGALAGAAVGYIAGKQLDKSFSGK